ncbi:MAG: metal ABC transporter permease, partial [Candidatus Curtissbacteria bacterium]|nr:metal ABC transporter permease [Candidatus Curtissbacteria bacterium]
IGALLIGALIVIPVLTASQMSKSFRENVIFSVILSMVSVFLGLLLSYSFDLASGGSIVCVSLAFFLISLLVKRK